MKITRTSSDENIFRMNKAVANKGCNICPCCGQPVDTPSAMCKTWFGHKNPQGESLFTELFGREPNHHYKVDCYKCWNCGAEWESDPYIYS